MHGSIASDRVSSVDLDPMARQKKPDARKDPAAVALGRKGGLRSRVNLTPEKRAELARKAARARWDRRKRKKTG